MGSSVCIRAPLRVSPAPCWRFAAPPDFLIPGSFTHGLSRSRCKTHGKALQQRSSGGC